MRTVLRNHEGDLLAPDAIKAYFQDLFWRNEDRLDEKRLLKLHRDHYERCSFPFQDIAIKYRFIENFMRPIIIPFDSNAEKWIERLHYAEYVGQIATDDELLTSLIHVERLSGDQMVNLAVRRGQCFLIGVFLSGFAMWISTGM